MKNAQRMIDAVLALACPGVDVEYDLSTDRGTTTATYQAKKGRKKRSGRAGSHTDAFDLAIKLGAAVQAEFT